MSKDNREELLQVGASKPHCLKCGKQLNETIGNICFCCAREVTIDSGADECEWSYEFSTHEYIVDCYGAISECDIDFNLIKTFKVCPYCTKPITTKGE